MSVLRGTKSLACPGRHIIGLPVAPKSSICGWPCVSHILCWGYYRPLKSEVRFLKSKPIHSTSSLHRHKEQHGIGVWPLLESNFIAVNWCCYYYYYYYSTTTTSSSFQQMSAIRYGGSGVDKAPGDAAKQASPWDSGAPKRTEYKNLLWILSDWILLLTVSR